MAKIPKRVYRNRKNDLAWFVAGGVALVAAAVAVAVVAGAGAYGWACVGAGALLTVLFVARLIQVAMDRRPRLVVDAEGVRDYRADPPFELGWADVKKLFVRLEITTTGIYNGWAELVLEVQLRDGEERRVTLPVNWLDATPRRVAAHIERVWELVTEAHGDDPVDEADEMDKPKPTPRLWDHPMPQQRGTRDPKPPPRFDRM